MAADSARELARTTSSKVEDGKRTIVDNRTDLGFKEWREAAKKSAFARQLRTLLLTEREFEEDLVEKYQEAVFKEIFDNIGQDPKLADELEAAVYAKKPKFPAWASAILGVLSCGIFYLIRPADDDALLVLTKQGRVLTLKEEMLTCIQGTWFELAITFIKYALLISFICSIPSVVLFLLMTHQLPIHDEHLAQLAKLQLDQKMFQSMRKHYVLSGEVGLVVLMLLVCYIWSKCPSDYGNRYRETFNASNTSAAQFVMHGRKGVRKVQVRVYFGKFPLQETMDAFGGTTGNSGRSVRVKPISSLGAAGGTGAGIKDAPRLSKPTESTMTRRITLFLSAVTMLDTAITWYQEANEAAEIIRVGKFCRDAPGPGDVGGPEYCTASKCFEWTEQHGHDDEFCRSIEWKNSTTRETKAACLYYGHKSPPCCVGCGLGMMAAAVKERGALENLGTFVELLGYVGTIFFSFMAARKAVQMLAADDYFDLEIQESNRRCAEPDASSRFDLILPTAYGFFDSVFDRSFVDAKGNSKAQRAGFQQILPHPQEAPGGGQREANAERTDEETPLQQPPDFGGVSNYHKDYDCKHWDDFVDTSRLSVPVEGSWTKYQVNVPVRCLGITDAELPENKDNKNSERILAAWSEQPPFRWAALSGPAAFAGLLFFSILIIPDMLVHVGVMQEDHLTGILDIRLRSLVGLCVAVLIVFLAFLYLVFERLFDSIEYAIVVTDRRIFNISYRPQLCMRGMHLQVDCYRHESKITYGSVESKHRSILQRIFKLQNRPGTVTVQLRFGVLEFTRNWGNVFKVFAVLAQLTDPKGAEFISKETVENFGEKEWDFESSAAAAESVLTKHDLGDNKNHPGVRMFPVQETDLATAAPALYLDTKTLEDGTVIEVEKPVFHWSFSSAGSLMSPFDTTTDLLVTTGRVFLWTRANHKKFNCRTCYLHGPMAWLNAYLQADQQANRVSFFTLGTLARFSTMTQVMPPRWGHPLYPPVRLPCWESIMNRITNTINEDEPQPGEDVNDWDFVPVRSRPRVNMHLVFARKFLPQQVDLMAVISPYHHNDFDDMPLVTFCGTCGVKGDVEDHPQVKKMRELRAIMGVVQELHAVAPPKHDKHGHEENGHDHHDGEAG